MASCAALSVAQLADVESSSAGRLRWNRSTLPHVVGESRQPPAGGEIPMLVTDPVEVRPVGQHTSSSAPVKTLPLSVRIWSRKAMALQGRHKPRGTPSTSPLRGHHREQRRRSASGRRRRRGSPGPGSRRRGGISPPRPSAIAPSAELRSRGVGYSVRRRRWIDWLDHSRLRTRAR